MGTICFFNSVKAWGGGEKWHFETSLHMHQKGHSVLVIAHTDSVLIKKLKEHNVPCIGIKINNLSFLNPLSVNSLKNKFKKHNIETIIINLSRDLKLAGLAAKKAGLNRIIYRRGSAIPIKNSGLNRFYFKNIVTDILANSIATKKTVLENNKDLFPENKIKVIYNGLDVSEFKNNENITSSTNKKDITTLVNLGRLEYQKNQQFLIHVADELKKRKIDFKMLIGGDGSLANELKKLTEDLKLIKEVEFSGFIDNPKKFIEQGDIFLLSSHWEGFGYVLAEASLCYKPIVAFDISSNPEVVINGKTGILTKEQDVNAFADAIVKLINNKGLQYEMGLQGSNFILNTFSKKEILNKIESYLLQ
ncbi:glycosyltransferase [Cellulophaga sp. HaHaR_3_176]|uniref:glycosyltransferase n=1 Tax=Cellulophaga sp. HaHaR_3_176 TaxID=1942464 RepID=UPI001C1F8117|nr:glycosyltransferase [Cellulophaga sp. HaHaR_3_176]QWX82710.1 glycosyltransferase [Cellulophaga sp. HaHaR_3_176]